VWLGRGPLLEWDPASSFYSSQGEAVDTCIGVYNAIALI
jgi:hypothetical protein